MLPGSLLALREGLEVALVIGIVFGVLQKIQKTHLNRMVWLGIFCAILVSLAAALTLNALGASFEGAAEEVFEGSMMLVAGSVLTWMIFWMQRQARSIKSELEADVRRAAVQRGSRALFGLAFVAVLREGIELMLFLMAAAVATSARQTLIGGLIGLGAAVILGWGVFAAAIRLDLRRFFQITGVLLILFSAGLVAQGVHEFNEAGWIPAIVEHIWDVNPVLDEGSSLGAILKALFGYNGNPSLTEAAAYLLYFVAILLGLRQRNLKVRAVTQEA